MKFDVKNGELVIALEGRIDSNNAAQTEKEVFDVVNGNAHTTLTLDLSALEYISSAGLRILLKLRKSDSSLKVINVSSDVYEIFDMTGFTEMMEIAKAYKTMSVDGCEVIGQGANGLVYRINDETIIKLYRNPDCLDDIKRERALAKKAFVLGIPTAISYEIVKVDDSYGSVFELLNAQSFAKLLANDPEHLDKYVELYIDLLKKIHSTVVEDSDMVDMRQTAISWAVFDQEYLPKDIGDKLVSLVKAVPYDKHMMHGDYHIKNVMMQNDEVLLIDMDTLCIGNPIFELGSMFNAYKGFASRAKSKSIDFLGIDKVIADEFWRKSLMAYTGTSDDAKINEVEQKAEVVGYMRLLRRLIRRGGLEDEEKKKEVDFYISKLVELVPKVDTLII